MRFLTTPECDDRARQTGIRPGKAGLQLTKPARHFVQLAYRSRMTNADVVAPILVERLGTFDWAVVWAYELTWGDRSSEEKPPPDWRDYAQWRRRRDEHRSVYDAPGHEFAVGEDEQLVEVLKAVIHMGWDARAFSNPLRCMVDLSHEDMITLRSHNNLSDVTARRV